eukprot:m.16011 g.16011  ORF g.16011 m.16011 type:complete len:344 (-) comp5561_c0_seq2:67-1098(-)
MAAHKFELVATDLDGTFLASNPLGRGHPDIPTDENAEIFHELHNHGLPVCMISGRSYAATAEMMDHLGLDAYVISFHGAAIFSPKGDGQDRELIKSWPLEADMLHKAASIAEKEGCTLMVYTKDSILSAGNAPDNFTYKWPEHNHETTGTWWARVGEFPVMDEKHPAFESLPSQSKERVRSLPLMNNSKYFKEISELIQYIAKNSLMYFKCVLVTGPGQHCNEVHEKTKKHIPPDLAHVMGPFGYWIEVIHPECNKATALRWLTESRLGSSLTKCVTFGDGLNDIEMLRDAGIGIAMANASPEVKKVASIVSEWANEDSAVARELRKLMDEERLYLPKIDRSR